MWWGWFWCFGRRREPFSDRSHAPRGNAAPDALRPYPQPAPPEPDRSYAPAWERTLGGLIGSVFRLDGESGGMHGHFPRHPLGHPNLQTRFAQTPQAPFSRQPCATRPCRRGLSMCGALYAVYTEYKTQNKFKVGKSVS